MYFQLQLSICAFIVAQLISQTWCKPHPDTISRHDAEHFMQDPDKHDVTFDHTAFLGEEQARAFSQMSTNESEQRLRDIVKKIDRDQDKLVTETELYEWIGNVANKSVHISTLKQWNEANVNGGETINWSQYTERIYGPPEERLRDKTTAEAYKKAITHDQRRWKAADLDKDGNLSFNEFTDFVHPEIKDHMRGVIIEELLESVDTDNDGSISEKEYLEDLAKAYQTPIVSGQPEPDWLQREREQFNKFRDINQDGKMDWHEVGEWIMPKNYDPFDAETKHLIYHSDENKDGSLTEEEIVKHRDLFVSSQATNYGTVLNKHEEL